jgi:DNA polymerase-3 subunit alpha
LRGQQIQLLPPDVNESYLGFTPLSGAIRYGLAAIKGIGNSAVNAIIEARKSGGFLSFFDFAERIEQGTLNKRTLESLVSAGAFDSLNTQGRDLNEWRAALHASIDTALSRAQRAKRERLQGQSGLFSVAFEENPEAEQPPPAAKPWNRAELLAAEKAALGFYITAHPLASYFALLQSLKAIKSAELPTLTSGSRISIGGLIADLQPKTTKEGDRFALLRLQDESGDTKCVVWPEAYRKYSVLLQNELPALVTGRLELSEDNPPTVIVDQIQNLDEILKNRELVVLRLPSTDDPAGFFDSILHLLNTHPGNCDVALEVVIDSDKLVRLKTNAALRIERNAHLNSALEKAGCSIRIERAELASSKG